MHRPVIDARRALGIDPAQAVLHPVDIVALREILARVRAAALACGWPPNGWWRSPAAADCRARGSRSDRCSRSGRDRRPPRRRRTQRCATASRCPAASDSPVRNTAASDCMIAASPGGSPPWAASRCAWRSRSRRDSASSAPSLRQRPLRGAGLRATAAQWRAASRPNTTRSSRELEPSRLAPCTETQAASPTAIRPGTTAFGIAVFERHHLAVDGAGDAAHVVVHGGQDRDRLAGDIDTGEDARGLGDARQALVDHLRARDARGADGCDPCAHRHRDPRGSRWSSARLTTSREARSFAFGA